VTGATVLVTALVTGATVLVTALVTGATVLVTADVTGLVVLEVAVFATDVVADVTAFVAVLVVAATVLVAELTTDVTDGTLTTDPAAIAPDANTMHKPAATTANKRLRTQRRRSTTIRSTHPRAKRNNT
jgi:hypothetical protein